MKKLLLGAAAALAIAAPSVAAAQSGYVDLSYQTSDGDVNGVDTDGEGWSAGGATAWGGNGSLGVQLDGVYSSADDVSAWNLGAHLFSRNDSHLFGGFVNFGNTDIDTAGDYDSWSAGLEGQIYLARTTIDGALTYSEADDLDATFTAADVGATHFVTDNFSIGGGVGFGNVETTMIGSVESDVLTYGLGAEWGFASAPISIYGGWQHIDLEDFDTETDTLSIGVRYNWGGSLFERNRSGASLARGGGLGRFAGLL